MGGNGWFQTGPYHEDLSAAFRRAQEESLVNQGDGFEGRSIDDLWMDPEWWEYIGTGGTGSVVDQYALIAPDAEEEFGTMRPLTEQEVREWAPGGRPTYAEWSKALDELEFYPGRGSGRCTVLYDDGKPVEMVYWGVTAD